MTVDTTSTVGYPVPGVITTAVEAAMPDTLEALAAALRRIQAEDDLLAPILSIATTGRDVQIYPWIPCAPITSLRSWEPHFDGAIDRRATALLDSEGKPSGVTTVTSTGKLDGLRVTLIVSTYREVPTVGAGGRVSEDAFIALAAEESALDSPTFAALTAWVPDGEPVDTPADEPDDEPDDDEPAAARVEN